MSFQNNLLNKEPDKCEECGEQCKVIFDTEYQWCDLCESINCFTDWTSGNKKIDEFIRENQINFNKFVDMIVLGWVPYNQFKNIKEMGKDSETILYSAIWKNGPLYYKFNKGWIKDSDKKVDLKCFYNSQNNINEFLNEVKKYSISSRSVDVIYGISQNPDTKDYIMILNNSYCGECDKIYSKIDYKWCKSCQINNLNNNFINWTSGNKKIDDLIQEKQLNIDEHDDVSFEWIPYNQFKNTKEIGKDNENTLYSAIWMDGPLYYEYNKGQMRNSDKKVNLKCFYNSQNITNEFLNEVKKYSTKRNATDVIYGISKSPDTNDYIIVLTEIYCEECGKEYTELPSKWCTCIINNLKNNFTNWTSGNQKIDDFIQEKQLNFSILDVVFEWIPYNQFNNIKEIGKDNKITLYSAIWENGKTRNPDKKVDLKCFYNSQNMTDEFLNEVKKYPTKRNATDVIYGISKNPDTNDYIIILNDNYCETCGKKYTSISSKWCKSCQLDNLINDFANWTSGNKNVDNLIQEAQLNIKEFNDILFQWIPYNQFSNFKEIGKGGFATVYSAIWKGFLEFNEKEKKYTKSGIKVALKCLHNSENISKEFLNEVKAHLVRKTAQIISIYGISQNPDTKEYIMVLEYAENGSLNGWVKKKYEDFNWERKIDILDSILYGLKEIHQKNMVHRDFHTGNILVKDSEECYYISDMGLCGEVGNMDETKVFGVMPYVAPEVLNGKSYTQAADIYSFGMLMYYIATGRQPFSNYAHDNILALNICNGIRPEIKESEAPKCYIDLMKRCWNSNPSFRPSITEIHKFIKLFINSYNGSYAKVNFNVNLENNEMQNDEIDKQFKEAEKYRQANLSNIENNQSAQAVYTSRLLNPYTKDLPKYDNVNDSSVEIIDFTNFQI
ncbi:kinase-like domain-containing protein [Glomus cerebriforme]|uniref:Kinase-like domain-containing protein n=1 Tax=Glomus cerebriforme TaxID=658196 RepID=A0A397SVC6_9GLOM|nr:kinase-like domain-containing protein [Glomus cerebriforme]